MVWWKRVGERCAINDGAGMFHDYVAGCYTGYGVARVQITAN